MKTVIISLFIFVCALTYGQTPAISYTSPQTYTVGTAISDLTPTNTGGPATTNTYVSTVTSGAFGSNVSGIAFSPDYSTIYAALQLAYVIKKVTVSTKTVADLAGTLGTPGFLDATGTSALFAATGSASIPSGLAVHPTTGELYFADTNNHRIRKISPSGVVSTVFGTGTNTTVDGAVATATINLPYDLAFDTDGSLYILGTTKLRKLSADGTTVSTIISLPTNTYGLAIDKTNRLIYISEKSGNKIDKLNLADNTLVTFAGSGTAGSVDGSGTTASFSAPRGLAVDANGNVYVADYSNAKIRKITPDGVVTSVAGTAGSTGGTDGVAAVAKFNGPSNLTFDGSGNLYVSASATQNIRKITFNNAPFSISPALPAGLNFDVNTGKISGTPTVRTDSTEYTIMASNVSGSSTAKLKIIVNTLSSVKFVQDDKSLTINNNKNSNTISIKGEIFEGSVAKLMEVSGKSIMTVKLNPGNSNTIQIKNVNFGVYLLQINDKIKIRTYKIIL